MLVFMFTAFAVLVVMLVFMFTAFAVLVVMLVLMFAAFPMFMMMLVFMCMCPGDSMRDDLDIRLMAVHNARNRAEELIGSGLLGMHGQGLLHEIDNSLADGFHCSDIPLDFRGAVRAVEPFERVDQFHKDLRTFENDSEFQIVL